MEYRNLGRCGLSVSAVGLGCNNFGGRLDADKSAAVVRQALDLGINFFDTADIYGGRGASESCLGRALEGKRQDVVIATKFGGPMGDGPLLQGASRRYIMQAAEASLKRLKTDYIDLYQLHFPDPRTPIEETMRALDELVRSGKVRYVGCSNFTAWQVVEASWVAKTHHLEPFVSAQNHYNLLDRRIERELVVACSSYGLGVLPYFPLASGLLTGKYKRGQKLPEGTRLAAAGPMAERLLTDRNWDTVERLEAFARERDHSLLELAFAWFMSKPYVSSIIAGATRPEQVQSNVEAISWRLGPDEAAEVDKLSKR